jgi:parallel beta-helix repeat protein
VSSSFVNILDSDFYSNDADGIHLFSSSDVTIKNSNIYQNMNSGIILKASENAEIENCEIYSNIEDGIYLPDSSIISIDSCTIYDHKNGIYMLNSSQITVKNSDIYDNKDGGISLIDSSENTLEDLNIYSSGDYGIYLTEDPIDRKGSSFNSIANVQITDNTYGIFIRFSRNNTIENATVQFNVNAIITQECENLVINNSNISNNDFYAISFIGTSESYITNNELVNNYYGIFLLAPSTNNIVHHNIIKDHTQYSYGVSLSNSWDDGSEGNYWGDYDGIDSNSDGIGDDLYPISPFGQDRFPLVDFYNTRFKILSTSPQNDSTLVPISTSIKFFLSEGAVKQTFEGNISIFPSTAITSYLWEDSDKTLTLDLPDLVFGELYTITVKTNATGVSGRSLFGSFILIFYTENPSDSTPPTVTKKNPTGSNVPLNLMFINITFSELMYRSSTESAFSITPWVPGYFDWIGNTMYFYPTLELSDLTTYTVTIDGSLAKDAVGFLLDGDSDGVSEGSPMDDYSWQFTAWQEDLDPPFILGVEPTGSQVDINSPIRIYFSEFMNKTTVEDAFSYTNGTITLTSTNGTWGKSVFVMTFVPTESFNFSQNYTVNLQATALDLHDNTLDGNANGTQEGSPADDYTWSFQTVYNPSLDLPTINEVFPEGLGIDIETEITINFSQEMNQDSVHEAFTITDGISVWNQSNGSFLWEGNKSTFVPDFTFDYGTIYFVKVNISAQNIEGEQLDGNKNGVADDEAQDSVIFSFRTIAPSDLVVSRVSINGDIASNQSQIWYADSGDIMSIGVNVSNIGYFSTQLDFNITLRNSSGFGEPMNITISPLGIGQDSGTQIFIWEAPTSLGDHFVEIIVDWGNDIFESQEDNNSFLIHFAVGPDYAPWNITVNGLDALDPSAVWYADLGIPVEIEVEAKNVGFSGVSPLINYSIVLWNATSSGVPIGPSAFEIFPNLFGLGAGESSPTQIGYWEVPDQIDDFYVVIIIDYDDTTLEIDEENNKFVLHFTYSPDYAFKNIKVDKKDSNDPDVSHNATYQVPVQIDVNITNIGFSGISDAVLYNLSFYNSTNRGTPLDAPFYSTSRSGLLSGEDSGEITALWIPPNSQGDFYVALIIDPLNELVEENENNNIFVIHFRIGPDIVFDKVSVNAQKIQTSPSDPIYVGLTENISLDVNLTNLGFSGTGTDFYLGFYNGTRDGGMVNQPYLNISIAALNSSQNPGADSGSIGAYWISPAKPGTFYVVLYADISSICQEREEDNNIWILTFIVSVDLVPNNVTVNGQYISSFTDETAVMSPGQSITIGANILNIGDSRTGTGQFGLAFYNATEEGLNLGPQFSQLLSLGPLAKDGFSSDLFGIWIAPILNEPTDYYINISTDHLFNISENVEGNNFYILHIRVDAPDLTPDKIVLDVNGIFHIFEDPKTLGFVSDEISLPLGSDLAITFDVINIGGLNQLVGSNVTFYNTSFLFGPQNATAFFETSSAWVNLSGKGSPKSDQTSEVGQTIIAQWTNPNIVGFWYINITIDPGNSVSELNESNNIFVIIINVTDFPATSISTDGASYSGPALYVTSTTQIGFNVSGGNPPFYTWYKIIDLDTNTTLKFANYTLEGTTFNLSWGEGTYRIEYNSTDSLGNSELNRSKVVIVDDTKPETQIILGEPKYRGNPAHYYNITSQTQLEFSSVDFPLGESASATIPNASQIKNLHYRVQNLTNGSFLNDWTLILENAIIFLDGPIFFDGTYRIWFNATDNLDQNETTKYLDVYLDNSGPSSSISVGNPKQPHPILDWYVSTISNYAISSIEGNGSDVNLSSIHYKITFIDGGISTQWIFDSSFDIYSVFWNGDGNYTIEFRAQDNLGNLGDLGLLSVYSDDSPPQLQLTISEPKYREFDSDLYNISDITPINLTGFDGIGSGTNNLEFRIFNATYDSGWTSYFMEFNLSGLNYGEYSIEILGIDNLGNFIIEGIQVYLDIIPPQTSLTLGNPKHRKNVIDFWNITSQTPITLKFDFDNGSGPDFISYKITNSTFDSGWINYSGEFFLDPLFTDGEYTIYFRGFDFLMNSELEHSQIVRLDNKSPMANISISGPSFGIFVSSLTIFTKNADDSGGSGTKTVWHRIYGSDTGFYYTGWLTTASFSLPSNLIDGNYVIEYYVEDNLLNSQSVSYLNIYLDMTTPDSQISILVPKYRLRTKDDWTVSKDTSFILFGEDGSGSGIFTVYYSIWNDMNVLVVSSAVYAGSFNLSGLGGDGNYKIEFWAEDNLGNLESLKELFVILDGTHPKIIFAGPVGSGNSVASYIRVVFSEEINHKNAMDAFSYSNGTFTWDRWDGFFNWNKNTMTFYAYQKLQYDTEYIVIINTTASDNIGNFLDGDGNNVYDGPTDIFTWSFKTQIMQDKISPYIVSVTPKDTTGDVHFNAQIIIEFSEIMDEISVEAAFRYSDGITIFSSNDGLFLWEGNTTTFTPFEPFKFDTFYTLTVSAAAKDILGNYMSAGYLWTFTTQLDDVPPEISGYSPMGDDVLVNTTITVTFNEPMNKSQVLNAIILVPGINGSFEWSQNTLIFIPFSNLKYATEYIVTVGLELTDLEGNSLQLPFQFNFTTEPDVFAPYVVNHYPEGIEINLDTTVSVTFNEEMNRISVEQSFIINPNVTGTFSWNGNTVTFHPQLLDGNTEYDITIGTSAQDVFGNSLESQYEFSFTTKVDPDPPYVVEVTPIGIDVPVDSDIVIRFNEPINISSLFGALVIEPYIPGTIDMQNDILVFTPNGKLTKGTTYNITLLGSAEDLAKNQMGENYTWEFTTEEAKVTTASPFAWDVLFFSLFLVVILLILILLFIEFLRKRKKKEEGGLGDEMEDEDYQDAIDEEEHKDGEPEIGEVDDEENQDIIDEQENLEEEPETDDSQDTKDEEELEPDEKVDEEHQDIIDDLI